MQPPTYYPQVIWGFDLAMSTFWVDIIFLPLIAQSYSDYVQASFLPLWVCREKCHFFLAWEPQVSFRVLRTKWSGRCLHWRWCQALLLCLGTTHLHVLELISTARKAVLGRNKLRGQGIDIIAGMPTPTPAPLGNSCEHELQQFRKMKHVGKKGQSRKGKKGYFHLCLDIIHIP